MITVNQPRENGRTTFCRQFTYNPKGEYNSRLQGAVVSGTPVAGIPVTNLPDGTLISIPENGSPVLFYKAKSDYESELNGNGLQLVVRKGFSDSLVWNTSDISTYATSYIDQYLNGDFISRLPDLVKQLIVSSKIRYTIGGGNNTISEIERKIFLPSFGEYGATFVWGNVAGEILPIADILKTDVTGWHWTRDAATNVGTTACYMRENGVVYSTRCSSQALGVRPSFCLSAQSIVSPEPNEDGSYNLIY